MEGMRSLTPKTLPLCPSAPLPLCPSQDWGGCMEGMRSLTPKPLPLCPSAPRRTGAGSGMSTRGKGLGAGMSRCLWSSPQSTPPTPWVLPTAAAPAAAAARVGAGAAVVVAVVSSRGSKVRQRGARVWRCRAPGLPSYDTTSSLVGLQLQQHQQLQRQQQQPQRQQQPWWIPDL